MWVCKECGGNKFKVEIDGFVEIGLNKDGSYEYKKETLNIRNDHWLITCCDCFNNGETIEELADWEEEDERN